MGFEKACNIKAAAANKAPDCVVIVATLRGLKANSGHYDLRPGMAIPDSIFSPDQAALVAGFENLKWHIKNVHKYGIPAVVAINQFLKIANKNSSRFKISFTHSIQMLKSLSALLLLKVVKVREI